jgi:RHS repeat-associated protein
VTNTGYVYDALGRNTFIPAVDAPNNNGGISLSYNVVDQVTSITQATSTSFTYDALGRRVNETNSGLTTQRHYTDGSDNPEWTSQLDGSLLTTEIYTGSLGAGLGVTTNIKGTTKTQTIQLTDLRGHTVTTLNLSTNSVSPLITYDSFGNPQSSQTSTNLINYSSYGQQERATNNTGLIFMGARLYNPKTNQFTSKDPISRGNENPYTYPNDPINTGDFSGLWSEWVSEMIFVILTILSIYYCPATEGVGCAFALVLGGVGGGLDSFNESVNAGRPWWEIAGNTLVGIGLGLFGMKYISKIVSKYGPKLVQFLISPEGLQKSYLSIPAFLKRFSKEYVAGKTTDSLVKTTYDLLVTYLAKLFSDRPKK